MKKLFARTPGPLKVWAMGPFEPPHHLLGGALQISMLIIIYS